MEPAGARSQVVWPSGVLASTAVGVAVDLVTNWTRKQRSHAYLVYDGNEGTIKESTTLRQLNTVVCTHFGESDVGDPALVEENC
jgi:molybdopterin-synthase adenylyltransferase